MYLFHLAKAADLRQCRLAEALTPASHSRIHSCWSCAVINDIFRDLASEVTARIERVVRFDSIGILQ